MVQYTVWVVVVCLTYSGRHFTGSMLTMSVVSNLEPVANVTCAQANSVSYPWQDGKRVAYFVLSINTLKS